MFKEMGAFMGLMKNLPKIQEELAKQQAAMGQISAEGDAGAGMVKVKINGHFQVLSVQIGAEAVQGGDREMLEDLVKSAMNSALAKVRQLMAQEAQKTMGSLGLPPGLPLPGMEG